MRWSTKQAVNILKSGGIVACPTEAVYGLSCDPLNADCVYRLLELKQRPVDKGLILVASHISQLRPFIADLAEDIENRITSTWPGPHTWIWPVRDDVPTWLTGAHDSIAVRVTAHPVMSALCEAFGGPLVSTSANIAGHHPQRNSLGVQSQFGNKIDYILTGSINPHANPTEIRDALTNEVIRAG